ncbi:MAG: hypothetical protein V6Z81_08165 [Parvularculales bacterium]
MFRIASDTGHPEYIATNDLSQDDVEATQQKCRLRWKIEQLHRELKQTTGMGECQFVWDLEQRGAADKAWLMIMPH